MVYQKTVWMRADRQGAFEFARGKMIYQETVWMHTDRCIRIGKDREQLGGKRCIRKYHSFLCMEI